MEVQLVIVTVNTDNGFPGECGSTTYGVWNKKQLKKQTHKQKSNQV